MKKNILTITVIFSFLAISAFGCAPRLKCSRIYIPKDDPVYDIQTIKEAPSDVVEAALTAKKEKKSATPNSKGLAEFKKQAKAAQKQAAIAHFVQNKSNKQKSMIARPNNQDFQEFLKRIKREKTGQKTKIATKKTSKIKKKSATLETRLAKVENRVNYAIQYGRENRNRIGLLEERFNLSTSGKIQAEIILFKPDSSKLSVDGEKFLKNLAIEYTGGKVENIVIKGHASVTKGKIDNKILAKKRAESAYSYLKARCVPAKIIPVGETDEYGINTNAMITWLGKR